MTDIKNRYDFILLFDVQDGNPNGDPDLDNQPRVDPETGFGLVTDVCLKRKVRNYIMLSQNGKPRYDIFVKEKAILNNLIAEQWDAAADGKKPKDVKEKQSIESNARDLLCAKYFDIRAFGAVLSTGDKGAGQVRGPIQLTFSRSCDPIYLDGHSITRMAVTKEADAAKERTMGRKYTVPYALYRCRGFVSPQLAAQTGFDAEDLEIFWNALLNMFELDRSAARGLMTSRRLIIFKHDSALGNASAESQFERVEISKRQSVDIPRAFSDYFITLDGNELSGTKTVVDVRAE